MDEWDDPKINKPERTIGFVWRSLKNFSGLLGDKKAQIIGLVFLLLFCQAITLFVPYVFKLIFDELPACLASGEVSGKLVFYLVGFFSLQLGGVIMTSVGVKWPMSRLIIYFENHWPVIAQAKLMSLSPGFHERENTGKKIAKIEKGCDKLLQLLIEAFWTFLPQLFYLVINMIIIFCFDWRLGLTLSVPIIVCIIWQSKSFERFFATWEIWETMRERSSGYLNQSISHVRTVQNFVQERREMDRFGNLREEMRELDYKFTGSINRLFVSLKIILNTAYALSVILGIYLAFKHEITVGTVVFVVSTGSVSIQSVISLVEQYNQILRKFVTVNRLKSLIDEVPDIADRGGEIPAGPGEISIEAISFIYPKKEHPVLADFSLTIKPTEMVAIVAKSGEGKTTLARLICRMYDVSTGKITMDGTDIREIDLYAYRRQFAIVQQDVEIFDGTLSENVVYPFDHASPEQVDEAIRAAYLHLLCEDKERMPQGIETKVGERGVRLSGGERQRVGIARAYIALLNGARFLILDEATSNLDSEAERAIQEMIAKLRERLDIAIVVIAHRLSTIKLADTICVINDGRVEEIGGHNQLMKMNGLYSRLVELQKVGSLRD
jgi:ABC-type multidrug transport system fused ATPase/permease subunit